MGTLFKYVFLAMGSVFLFVLSLGYFAGDMLKSNSTAVATAQPAAPARPVLRTPAPPPAPLCVVEDWRWHMQGRYLTIEGASSCRAARITARLYDGSKFLGADSSYVRDYAFTMMLSGIKQPNRLTMKYTVTPQ